MTFPNKSRIEDNQGVFDAVLTLAPGFLLRCVWVMNVSSKVNRACLNHEGRPGTQPVTQRRCTCTSARTSWTAGTTQESSSSGHDSVGYVHLNKKGQWCTHFGQRRLRFEQRRSNLCQTWKSIVKLRKTHNRPVKHLHHSLESPTYMDHIHVMDDSWIHHSYLDSRDQNQVHVYIYIYLQSDGRVTDLLMTIMTWMTPPAHFSYSFISTGKIERLVKAHKQNLKRLQQES